MSELCYKVKPDTAFRAYWRSNAEFADLFNAVLFGGKPVIDACSYLNDIMLTQYLNGQSPQALRGHLARIITFSSDVHRGPVIILSAVVQ